MKKTLILTILIFGSWITKAQTYVPFPDSNVYWNEIELYQGYCDPPEYCRHSYFYNGDTIIDSEIYHKLYDNDSSSISYVGAIREENKKIHFVYENCDHSIVLYDFNLNVGDVMYVPLQLCDTVHGSGFMIHSIDSILLEDMTYRKRYNNNSFGYSWIEGIGSENGLLYPYYQGIACICFLSTVCVKQNDQFLFIDESYVPCFDFFVSNHENTIQKKKIEVYPNPVSINSTFYINAFDELIKRIDIFNSQGIEVESIRNIDSEQTLVTTQNLNTGLYFLKIYYNNNLTFKRLIIK